MLMLIAFLRDLGNLFQVNSFVNFFNELLDYFHTFLRLNFFSHIFDILLTLVVSVLFFGFVWTIFVFFGRSFSFYHRLRVERIDSATAIISFRSANRNFLFIKPNMKLTA
jgi:hypothetical protein